MRRHVKNPNVKSTDEKSPELVLKAAAGVRYWVHSSGFKVKKVFGLLKISTFYVAPQDASPT